MEANPSRSVNVLQSASKGPGVSIAAVTDGLEHLGKVKNTKGALDFGDG